MPRTIELGGRPVGAGEPVYVIAEIGINHNGSLEIAQAADRPGQGERLRRGQVPETNAGEVRARGNARQDARHTLGLHFLHGLSLQDRIRPRRIPANRQLLPGPEDRLVRVVLGYRFGCVSSKQFNTPCLKIPSASLTDRELLEAVRATGRPMMLSTGMSSMEQIETAVGVLGTDRLLLAHATSTYPCPKEELNLRMITTLLNRYDCPIGYSGHEVGLATTVAAIALGASFIERHITLDRAMWGSDQAASIEPQGLKRLVKDIRNVESAFGDGRKQVYPSEVIAASRLRLKDTLGAKKK